MILVKLRVCNVHGSPLGVTCPSLSLIFFFFFFLFSFLVCVCVPFGDQISVSDYWVKF